MTEKFGCVHLHIIGFAEHFCLTLNEVITDIITVCDTLPLVEMMYESQEAFIMPGVTGYASCLDTCDQIT